MTARATAAARVGLLGNPSDAYGGHVVAFTVEQLRANVEIDTAPGLTVVDAFGRPTTAACVDDCAALIASGALGDGAELLAAALVAMQASGHEVADLGLRFDTGIPREVGLSGSSAIIIAALRALGERSGHRWDPVDLARVALAAEVDVLGIAAGPQDRVVQAMGGFVDMDFATPWHAPSYHRLPWSALPPLLVAWDERSAGSSSLVHTDVRARWYDGDPEVRSVMDAFAHLGRRGAEVLGDRVPAVAALADLVDEAFALRQSLWTVSDSDAALVALARAHDAGASLAGSGGSVVMVPRDPAVLPELADALAGAGAHSIRPQRRRTP